MQWDIDRVSKYLPTKHLLIIYTEKSNHTLEVLDKHHINQVIDQKKVLIAANKERYIMYRETNIKN